MEVDRIHKVIVPTNRMDRMEGVGADKDNIAFLTVEVVIVNMKFCLPFMDIDNFHICMPMKENIGLPIFHDGSRNGIRSEIVLVGDVFVKLS